MAQTSILAMIMAGGKGERLHPLTSERAKPAVTFGGKYRIIDFVLSNFVNSGITSLYVLTQFKAQSLLNHLRDGWQFGTLLEDHFIIPVPAQMRMGKEWYRGTADAVWQNIVFVERHQPEIVAVFGADHIYRMDVRQMVEFHRAKGADVTVAALPVPRDQAPHFGVIQVDEDWRITGFQEKPSPKEAAPIPNQPEMILSSMGNYLFNTDVMLEELAADAEDPESDHDFGNTILPKIYPDRRLYAYDFRSNQVPGRVKGEEAGYWRDVGTLSAYWQANMDLCATDPIFNLYNRHWPLRTANYNDPPAKFVFDEEGRRGQAVNSIVSEGCVLSGARVSGSVLGRNVFVHSYATVEESVIFDNVDIGRGCQIRRAIIDKNVHIPPGTKVGLDPTWDQERFFVDKDHQITVIPRWETFELEEAVARGIEARKRIKTLTEETD
ncbi:glucose-1-phosphate adenylyltransferase [Nitrospinae bacterium AH_259_B05_G02_I21]|nr:glucose-1-phosphate adenylyltransferase [Nitrospinae bacterium AH_259_B05_G02_I21]